MHQQHIVHLQTTIAQLSTQVQELSENLVLLSPQDSHHTQGGGMAGLDAQHKLSPPQYTHIQDEIVGHTFQSI